MPKIQNRKEKITMGEKGKVNHETFCNYEIKKAKQSRILSVCEPKRKPLGIRTSNLPKAILAQQLASLF